MATGDTADIIARLKARLPRWFGSDSTSILDAVLTGIATAWASVYQLYVYVVAQARIATATGAWLDMVAADFFGSALARVGNETDAVFRKRILAALLRERATRASIRLAVLDLTGREPVIFEPARPADTGGYGVGGVGYAIGGGYGSVLMPYQALVTVYRPAGGGIPLVAGYGISTGAYRTPSRSSYASITDIQQDVPDAEIYAAIDAAKVAGTVVWTSIQNNPPAAVLGRTFVIGKSTI